MNLLLHQFKTDFRHYRWWTMILWASFAAEPVLVNLHWTSIGLMSVLLTLLRLGQVLLGLFLVTSLVQADPLVGTSAAWLTRPIRRAHLFLGKTLFVIVCLLLPRWLFQMADWASQGYSAHLFLLATEESLLFAVPVVVMVAGLAGLTRNLAQFFLAVAITIGGMFLWAPAVEILVHWGLLHRASAIWPHALERNNSAEVLSWIVFGAGALAAWIFHAWLGWRRVAVACLAAGLMAFPVITTAWSKIFLAPKLLPSAPLTLSLVESNAPVTDPQTQLLSSEFAVSGVPSNQVAVIEGVSATFSGPNFRVTGSPNDNFFQRQGRLLPGQSSQGDNYLSVIKGFFPTDTLWFSDNYNFGFGGWVQSAFNNGTLSAMYKNRQKPVSADGEITVDLYQIKKVAELPLEPGTFNTIPGLRMTIQKAVVSEGVITIWIDESATHLVLDRDVNMMEAGLEYNNQPFCTYVLYHPGSGEAFVMPQPSGFSDVPALLGTESHRSVELSFPYSPLRERLAGVSAADWLNQARLCVFAPLYAGTTQLAFHQNQYHWPVEGENASLEKEQRDSLQVVRQAVLPANPSTAQLNDYYDTVLNHVPENWNNSFGKIFRDKIEAPGVEGIPVLLSRLPLEGNAEYFVMPVITKLVTRAQLPDLQAALQRDNRVVEVFVNKHWEADAQRISLAKLADHRQPLPPEILRIAAGAKDPATYPDLRWHFIHLAYGQDRVAAALEQCPGFDTDAAVREAWQYARLDITGAGDLAAAAAKQGLPDALNRAVIDAENAAPGALDRKLAQLAALTGYTGPANQTLSWLAAHLGHFRYDAAQQRYLIDSGSPP